MLCWSWEASADGAARWLNAGGKVEGVVVLMRRQLKICGLPCVVSWVSVWLLAADRGGWRFVATASAVWDCAGGRRSQQRHRGMAKLAADCGRLLFLA